MRTPSSPGPVIARLPVELFSGFPIRNVGIQVSQTEGGNNQGYTIDSARISESEPPQI